MNIDHKWPIIEFDIVCKQCNHKWDWVRGFTTFCPNCNTTTEDRIKKCIVASEDTWKLPEQWNKESIEASQAVNKFFPNHHPDDGPFNYRPTVLVPNFAVDWDGTVESERGGCIIAFDDSKSDVVAEISHVYNRMFQIIDDCPNVDFILECPQPQNVRKHWKGYFKQGEVKIQWSRDNVYLAVEPKYHVAIDGNNPGLMDDLSSLCKDVLVISNGEIVENAEVD